MGDISQLAMEASARKEKIQVHGGVYTPGALELKSEK